MSETTLVKEKEGILIVTTGASPPWQKGIFGYATKALMEADLTPPEGAIARVTNDPNQSYNWTYIKSGVSGAGSWIAAARDDIFDLQARVAYLESVWDSISATPEVFYYIDATVGEQFVDVPAANDPLARVVTVVKKKTDTTENPVTFRPAAGTVDSSEGAAATCSLIMTGEVARFVPNAAENHYYRGA